MKKILALSVFALLFCTSCTVNNSEKPLICQSLGFDMNGDGEILVTACYSNTGTVTETGGKTIIKSYTAKNPSDAVDILLSEISDAMYKPLESLFVGKSLDGAAKKQLAVSIMNRAELQLKCSVLECENASENVRAGKKLSENDAKSFSEYYRTVMNLRENSV